MQHIHKLLMLPDKIMMINKPETISHYGTNVYLNESQFSDCYCYNHDCCVELTERQCGRCNINLQIQKL